MPLLLCILIIWQIQAFPQHPFNMYSTNHHHQDGFCLLYYAKEISALVIPEMYISVHQIIPYCLRPLEESNIFDENFNFNNTYHSTFTFGQLREKNISSQLLLSWSASIDLVESYEMFLNNATYFSSVENETLFHNCTSPWFGPFCRFTFDPLTDRSFDQIIDYAFKYKSAITVGNRVTCYEHHNCQTRLTCLDWREICDRKMDCFDGSDELNCWQLEINECAENEYRCHNGQCIPEEFFYDSQENPDCLDRTDQNNKWLYHMCRNDAAFRCEEYTCRPGMYEFPCGYGECTLEGGGPSCLNGRNNPLLENRCMVAMMCIMRPHQISSTQCKQFSCEKTDCIKDSCPSTFEFPPGPILFGHVRFVYKNNRTLPVVNQIRIHLPDYVCYNETLLCRFSSSDSVSK